MSINEMTDKYRVTYLSVKAQEKIRNNMKSLVRRLDRAYDWVQENIGNDALEYFIAHVEGDEEE